MSNDEIRLFLLDGMSIIYRAHFAMIRNPRIASTGMNTSAVLGYYNIVSDVIKRWEPTHLAVAFDTPEPTFRHEEFPEYKAQREKMPEDLATAVPYVFRLTEAMNIPILRYPGFEADDVIGTLAKRATERGITTYMVTPDKDYAQLVSDHVKILKPSRDGIKELGVEEILDEWGITRIDQVVDMLGLMGDTSDNIPGVPGIGQKTAQKLIEKFDSLEGLLANTDQLKGKQKEKVEANVEMARLSKRLVTIDTSMELTHKIEEFERKDVNQEELMKLFVELEFETLGKRLFGDEFDASSKQNMGPLRTIKDVEHSYQVADSDAKIAELVAELGKQKMFCFDLETNSKEAHEAEIVGISFCWEPHKAWYVPFPDTGLFGMMQIDPFREVLQSDIVKVGHNLKFDIAVLRRYDVKVGGRLIDTMLAQYLIDPDERQKMDFLAQKYLSYDPITYADLTNKSEMPLFQVPVDEVAEYCCEDSDITLQLWAALEPLLKKDELEECFLFECDLIRVLVEMEFQGIRLDAIRLHEYSKQLQDELAELEKRVFELAGRTFNIGSPKQIGEIFFDVLKLEENPKKTKTGQYKTDEQVMERLAATHEIARVVLDHRQLSKLKNTYVDQLPKAAQATGRVHTSFSQSVTATGRMASSNPNMQNIPIRTARGREIRRAFVASEGGYQLLSADYSQIELRIIAELSQAPQLIEAFKAGEDIHTATAAHVFGVDMDDVTREMRSKSKMVNYGLAYGMTAFGLAQRLNISRYEAKDIIDQYFGAFPGIKRYMDETKDFAHKHGYVKTVLGRRRYLRDINSRNGNVRMGAERNAINMPIQGTSADMIKIAMVNIYKALEEGKLKSRMLLQIHDELVFDVHKDEVDQVKEIVRREMVDAIPMTVPIEVDMGVGEDWLEAH